VIRVYTMVSAWWRDGGGIMNEGYLTIPEIAKKTGIPASTVRRYLDQHSHALRTKKGGRGAWLLKEDDVSLVQEIRACYERKMSVDEVEEYLLKSGQPLTVTVDDQETELTITPAQAFMQLAETVQDLREEITSTKEQLSSAHEEIRELKDAQKNDFAQQQKAVAALSDEMKSIGDGITRLEREKKKREDQSLWSRLFGR